MTQASGDDSDDLLNAVLTREEDQDALSLVVAEDYHGQTTIITVDPQELTSGEVDLQVIRNKGSSRGPVEPTQPTS